MYSHSKTAISFNILLVLQILCLRSIYIFRSQNTFAYRIQSMYTERQKKLITSSGQRPLKSMLSKLIIFAHKKKALILLNKNIWKTQDFLTAKRRKMWLNHERSFFEIRKYCSPSELWASSMDTAYSKHSIAIHSISMAGCVNAVRAIVCFELPAREASSVCDFWKLTSCDFIALSPLSLKSTLFF